VAGLVGGPSHRKNLTQSGHSPGGEPHLDSVADFIRNTATEHLVRLRAMQFDITLIEQLCREVGLSTLNKTGDSIGVDLGEGAVLSFENWPDEDDSAMGFSGAPWHMHPETLMFADSRGHHIECDYLDLLVGLQEGRILVCEQLVKGQVLDRWLVHHVYNDEFQYLEPGEKIVVRRVITNASSGTKAAADPR
jgi:hypothetical protein